MGHSFFFFFLGFIISFWLCWIFVALRVLPLVAESGSCSFAVVLGFLIAVASLVAERRL